jgi:hypothetical protein
MKGNRKQRRMQDQQAVKQTAVSPMLANRLLQQCQGSGYEPHVGVNSLMTAAGSILRQCYPQGEEAQQILGRHLKAAADEVYALMEGFYTAPGPEMVN